MPSPRPTRYVAFLRGVSPTNCSMPDLTRAFELAGFTDVKTVLATGNVAFTSPKASDATLAKKAEAAIEAHLGRRFSTIVRASAALEALIVADPFAGVPLPDEAKRVVTFLRTPPFPSPRLPVVADGVQVISAVGLEAFTAYVADAKGPVFMVMIEKTFGKDVTTRTWDTVRKCAAA